MKVLSTSLMTIAALVASASAEVTIVDLSQPEFETSPLLNDNPGADTIMALAQSAPEIRTALVVEAGRVVAEYVRDDVDPSIPNQVWSTTKTWMSLAVGIMVQDGVISTDETLAEIFPDEALWQAMNLTDDDRAFRRAITLYEMLTMNSGLTSPSWKEDVVWDDGGNLGGATLQQALEEPTLTGDKTFAYLASNNILSYMVPQRTDYATPREYLAAKVFPFLGIQNDEIDWWRNEEGLEYAYHGLLLTPTQMAKLGQLYLQDGKSDASTQLIDEKWVSRSTSLQGGNVFYGFLWWVYMGALMDQPDMGTVFCAQGLGGQDVCVSPKTERVVVQQRDPTEGTEEDQGSAAVEFSVMAMLPSTVFDPSRTVVDAVEDEEEEDDEEEEEEAVEENTNPISDIINSAAPASSLAMVVSLWCIVSALI